MSPQPPIFVRGGKRLNFSREDEWDARLHDDFQGFGKDRSCYPSCSWEELCAMAKLIVEHPAFRLPKPTDYYPPTIEN